MGLAVEESVGAVTVEAVTVGALSSELGRRDSVERETARTGDTLELYTLSIELPDSSESESERARNARARANESERADVMREREKASALCIRCTLQQAL